MADFNDYGSFSYSHQLTLNDNYLSEGNLSKEEKKRLDDKNNRDTRQYYDDEEKFNRGDTYINGVKVIKGTKIRFSIRDYRNDLVDRIGTLSSIYRTSNYGDQKFNINVRERNYSDCCKNEFENYIVDIKNIRDIMVNEEWKHFH